MDGGYEPERFIGQIRHDLICCICLCVLKNPRLCEAGEHLFCLSCITRSLANDEKCPKCRQHLTLATLKHPQGLIRTILSELKIKCVYIDRGCPEQVELGNLQDHANNCEYRPVSCENCRREIEPHITRISRRLDEMEESQNLYSQQVNEVNNSYEEIRTLTNEIEEEKKNEVIGNKRKYGKIHETVKKMKTNVNKLTPSQAELNIKHLEMARKQDQMEVRQDETKKALDKMKQTQSGINEKVEKMEMMERKLERVEGLFGQLFQENIFNRNGAQATDPTIPTNNQDVIILGGWYDFVYTPPLNTVEKYNIVEKRSTMLPPLNHPRALSASCVYDHDILVVGGFDGKEGTDRIEVLKMNQHPLRWTMFDGKLPVKLSSHDVIVYQGKLYIIGGYDENEGKASTAIYEIALTPPYTTTKLLTRMPEARCDHRAELVNGKLFIFGGTTTGRGKDALDSVVVYDLINNEFKPYPSLPQPVSRMSTVTWGNMIILVGGQDENEEALSDVIMYDAETGRSEKLPSMIYKRSGCSAVIMNDVIVVFGGFNRKQKELNSVETFSVGGNGWEEQPGMIERRWYATAVVKPHI
ncbi:uncharacterized protein LOC114538420 [Dendronephthya gigantea]|uniref:uncharacterized protein LOC114538420 n=1 Tax=Dendronephthya gigantea TaxID=151771 RepID=UPI00106A75C3|nr:uncharacterized protein LOC114538420 [Dendronephthya gigantea]